MTIKEINYRGLHRKMSLFVLADPILKLLSKNRRNGIINYDKEEDAIILSGPAEKLELPEGAELVMVKDNYDGLERLYINFEEEKETLPIYLNFHSKEDISRILYGYNGDRNIEIFSTDNCREGLMISDGELEIPWGFKEYYENGRRFITSNDPRWSDRVEIKIAKREEFAESVYKRY